MRVNTKNNGFEYGYTEDDYGNHLQAFINEDKLQIEFYHNYKLYHIDGIQLETFKEIKNEAYDYKMTNGAIDAPILDYIINLLVAHLPDKLNKKVD